MSRMQEGGEVVDRTSALLRLIMWLAIRVPKKRHSDPKKVHMRSFRWFRPGGGVVFRLVRVGGHSV